MLGQGLRQHLRPEWVLGLRRQVEVWAKLWEEVGFVALAGSVALNSCVPEGLALQVVWV